MILGGKSKSNTLRQSIYIIFAVGLSSLFHAFTKQNETIRRGKKRFSPALCRALKKTAQKTENNLPA